MQGKRERHICGAIDIGTNSIKLLIAEVKRSKLTPLFEKVVITRLGKNLTKKNTLENKQVIETINVLRNYLKICHSYNVAKTFAVCTQALRVAKNAKLFLEKCNGIGIQPKIINGKEEARLAYLGATCDIVTNNATVLDIGGGSIEIVKHSVAKSLNIGAVTLTEKFMKTDPPSSIEISKVKNCIHEILQDVNNIKTKTLIGVGGTITTLSAISQGSFNKIHKNILSHSEIKRVFRILSSLPLARRQNVKCLEPKRADIIIAGALILIEVMYMLKVENIIVSTKGIRHGLLIDKLSCN